MSSTSASSSSSLSPTGISITVAGKEKKTGSQKGAPGNLQGRKFSKPPSNLSPGTFWVQPHPLVPPQLFSDSTSNITEKLLSSKTKSGLTLSQLTQSSNHPLAQEETETAEIEDEDDVNIEDDEELDEEDVDEETAKENQESLQHIFEQLSAIAKKTNNKQLSAIAKSINNKQHSVTTQSTKKRKLSTKQKKRASDKKAKALTPAEKLKARKLRKNARERDRRSEIADIKIENLCVLDIVEKNIEFLDSCESMQLITQTPLQKY